MHRDDVRPRRSPFAALLASAALVCAFAGGAAADHPVGPPIGNNRFKTMIERGRQGEDRDDYTAVLARGDRLSFTIRSPFQSPLLPEFQLLDPDGRDRGAEARVKERAGGKVVSVKAFEIDRTGLWAVRIGGRIATEGAYVVSFKVAPPPRVELRDLELGGSGSTERTHVVEAADGSSLDVDVTWARGAPPVRIVAVEDPSGRAVVDDAGRPAAELVRTKKKGAALRKLRLSGGDGAYAIRVDAPEGATSYRIRWRVRAPQRPTGLRKLEPIEPYIVRPAADRIQGVAGRRVRVDGGNYSTGERPRVLFGAARGSDVVVDPTGGFLEVTVPPGVDGALVSVAVVNPDDQGALADDLFFYVPPPVITRVDDAAGNPVAGVSAVGGTLVRVVGESLRSGQLVRFGSGPTIIPIVRDGALEVVTRAQEPGRMRVFVTDSYGHEAASPEEFELKAPPTFAAQPYTPAVAAAAGGTSLLVRGSGFEATDELTFDGDVVSFELVSPSYIRFTPPARTDGLYSLRSVDRLGLVGVAPLLRMKAPGVVDAVTPTGGAFLGATDVSIHGGSVVELQGSRFHAADTVTIGGLAAAASAAADERLIVDVPPAVAGVVDVVVTDAAAQETTVADALRYVGFRDRSATRAPTRTTLDDRSALRGAVGDLDGDGEVDDVVLVSHDSAPGTRTLRTRLLIGSAAGVLADATPTRLPAAGSDASQVDDLRAAAVAVGDLDGANGADVLIAGAHPDGNGYGELRWLVNDGYGVFALDEDSVPGSTYTPPVTAVDENGAVHEVYSARAVRGRPTALAIGDLDGDDDLDVVVGRDSFESLHAGVDEAVVDFSSAPPYVSAADAAANDLAETRYHPGVRVILNRVGSGQGLVDVTAAAVPSAGDDGDATPRPAFHARDLALADLDGDDDLDLVVTWDDPTTTTAYGLSQGPGVDTARLATRVLLNDGSGTFTDATDDWMPTPSSPEWYQATRLALADLDGDGDPDLVLLHEEGVDAYQGQAVYVRRALRVLRNDHDPSAGTGGLSDVSEAVLPTYPPATNDNHRGVALRVADVDGDGALDLLLSATAAPRDDDTNAPVRALRLLSGTPVALAFRDNTGFVPPRSIDSGEADDLLLVPDLSSETRPALLVLSETIPAISTGSRALRVLDWQR